MLASKHLKCVVEENTDPIHWRKEGRFFYLYNYTHDMIAYFKTQKSVLKIISNNKRIE